MSKNIQPVEFSKEVSMFIEGNGNREGNYYFFPFYFKKAGECLFEVTLWNESNGELKHIVEKSEDPNPEEHA